uniref:Uncharacterized protein n=1 Tax=Sphaerodactylus townsendi TaxID=933632 RepID=A0ACB8FFZ6_9SAUR
MYYLYLFMVIDLSNNGITKPPAWGKTCLWMYTVCLLLGFLPSPFISTRTIRSASSPTETHPDARSTFPGSENTDCRASLGIGGVVLINCRFHYGFGGGEQPTGLEGHRIAQQGGGGGFRSELFPCFVLGM